MDAKVPAEAMQPTDSDLSYPSRFISGSAILPNTAAVAMEAPETAPKSAQPKQVATIREPGRPRLSAWTPS